MEVNLLDRWGGEEFLECTLLRLLQGCWGLVNTPRLQSQLAPDTPPLLVDGEVKRQVL